MLELILIILFITGFLIILVERSYRIYQLKLLIHSQSKNLQSYKNKKENFSKNALEEMNQNNHHGIDILTGLMNKSSLEKKIDNLIIQSERFNNLFAIALLNIHEFEDFQNQISEDIKNKYIKEVAERIKKTIRGADIVGREKDGLFIILFPNMTKPEIIVHAIERIIKQVSLPIEIDNQKIEITSNTGIVIYPYDGENKKNLLENASSALEKAKYLGSNTFVFYQTEIQILGEKELDLKSIVQQKDFLEKITLNYSPYYNILKHEIHCIEIDAVLNDSEIGQIPFSEFVRVAHYSSKLFELYEWMIKSAIYKFDDFSFDSHKKENIYKNRFILTFSLKQFEIPKFLENIIQIITKLSSSKNEIIMSITDEDIDNTKLEKFKEAVEKLNTSKIPIAIGILLLGHFAIKKINGIYFSYLKIDEKLIKNLGERKESFIILEKIMSLADMLKIETLTSGVDTTEQKNILENLGCVTMQGKSVKKEIKESIFMK